MTKSLFSVRLLAILFVAGGLGLGSLGCGDEGEMEDVEVIDPQLTKTPSGTRSFRGTLVNSRPRALSIAQIEVELYDESGSPVETIRFEVKDIPAEDSVSFSETIDSDRPFSQAQVKSILTP